VTHLIVYTNVAPVAVFLVGVKAEDQHASEYGFLGLFSEAPFGACDDQGNLIVNGLPLPLDILPATPAGPGMTMLFAFAPESVCLRRVVATNAITHGNFTNLLVQLGHGRKQVVLENHSPGGGLTNQTRIYEDNGAGDITGSQASDGPGSLRDYIGDDGLGFWLVTLLDTSLTNAERLQALIPTPRSRGADQYLPTTRRAARRHQSHRLPLQQYGSDRVYLRRGALPTRDVYDKSFAIACPSPADLLPVAGPLFHRLSTRRRRAGTAAVIPAAIAIKVSITSTERSPFWMCAVSQVLFSRRTSIEVGAGAWSIRGFRPGSARTEAARRLGGDVLVTNVLPHVHSGDFNANTNIIQVGQNSGTLVVDYDFYSLPDTLHVYYDGSLIFDSGPVSNGGQFVVDFGPGASTAVVLVMNEGNNTNVDTAWEYQASVVSPFITYLVFTEDAATAPVDIKFAAPPFASGSLSNLFCLPEESLNAFVGETAFGNWNLEIRDSRAGAASPLPQLLSWQLQFVFENGLPPPVIIAAQVLTNSFCLTWASMPGTQYHVQGKTNLTDSGWTVVSPALTAPAHQTTWCLALPAGIHYFRVQQ
jgi:hypothetical protein